MSAFNVQCFSIFPLSNLSVCDGEHERNLVQFVHPLVEYRLAISADMSVDVSAENRSTFDCRIS